MIDISKKCRRSCRLSSLWRQWKYSFYRYWSSKLFEVFSNPSIPFKTVIWFVYVSACKTSIDEWDLIMNCMILWRCFVSRLKYDRIRTRRHSDLLFRIVFWWQVERKSDIFICLAILSSLLISFQYVFFNFVIIKSSGDSYASCIIVIRLCYWKIFFRARVRREV